MNKLLAKHLSKSVSGFGGMLVHFIIMSVVVSAILIIIGIGATFALSTHTADEVFGITASDRTRLLELENTGDLQEAIREYPAAFYVTAASMLLIPASGPIAFIIAFILTAMRSKFYRDAKKAKKPFVRSTFGAARYAVEEEVKAAGLIGAGIVFGTMGNGLIEKPPTVEGHTLIVGGTGTGKSRGIVIPSLLRWPGAALAVDIKGELSRITAEKRKVRGRVFVFDPTATDGGSRYDPIAACKTLDAAQDLARSLIPIPPSGTSDPFWINCAQAIAAAYIYEGSIDGKYLSDIAETLCMEPITDLVAHCRKSSIREVRLLASVAYDMPEKTLGGVVSEIKAHMITLASDDSLRRATSGRDWSMADLENGATVYLKLPEHLLEQYKALWTAIVGQALRYLSTRGERAVPPILLALDELPRFGAIYHLTDALATLRSRNVHILAVVQSMAQLDTIYGNDQRKVIADNCRYKYVLSATDPETQKYFSDLAGQQTVLSKNESGNFLKTHGRSEVGAPLIRPEDWAHLAWPVLLAPQLYPARLALVWWDKITK